MGHYIINGVHNVDYTFSFSFSSIDSCSLFSAKTSGTSTSSSLPPPSSNAVFAFSKWEPWFLESISGSLTHREA